MTPSRVPPTDRSMGAAGVTLVELIVAVGIFMLVIGTATGSYVTFTRAQRSGLGQATVLADIQTFFETLERDLRTGFGSTFSASGSTFSFTNQERQNITYRVSGACIARVVSGTPNCLSSGGVAIQRLGFSAVAAGTDPGPPPALSGQQGRVTIRLRACPRGVTDERCVAVQTTLTSRQYAAP